MHKRHVHAVRQEMSVRRDSGERQLDQTGPEALLNCECRDSRLAATNPDRQVIGLAQTELDLCDIGSTSADRREKRRHPRLRNWAYFQLRPLSQKERCDCRREQRHGEYRRDDPSQSPADSTDNSDPEPLHQRGFRYFGTARRRRHADSTDLQAVGPTIRTTPPRVRLSRRFMI